MFGKGAAPDQHPPVWLEPKLLVDMDEQSADIDEQMMESVLDTADLPPPDLVIRTSGEQRLSNFLMWQAAYAELYFSQKLWPEFDSVELERAIAAYASRERRFGKTSSQVVNASYDRVTLEN
jgi:undecaprenyl diphosphate synthase